MPHVAPILVAPDSYKGTLEASAVAEAMARGLERAGWAVEPCPVADGGEGTMDVLLAAGGGDAVPAEAHDPLGRPLRARLGLLRDGSAVVETAAASGLALVDAPERDPEAASTAGTGELIAAAVAAGAGEVLVGVGGSATTDGGAGAIAAIHEASGLRGARLTVLCDVRTPFERAAEVFGPQKGAGPDAVRRLSRRLRELAGRLPRDPRGLPMTGAAGGLAGGLWAAFGARLVPGAAYVLEALGFDARARAAHAVVTGEGRLDRQTLDGKAAGEVAARCRQHGVPCYAIVGADALEPFDRRLLDLAAVEVAGTPGAITAAARRLGGRL
jgi:glycerate kinase